MELTRTNLEVVVFASDDEERPNLCGLHVTQQGTVATNGHVLARVGPAPQMTIDEVGAPLKPLTVSTDAVQQLLRAIPKPTDGMVPTVAVDIEATNANGALHVGASAGLFTEQIVAQALPGEFPDDKSIWPKGKPITEIGFAAIYLQRIGAFARKVGIKGLQFTLYGGEQAVRVVGRTKDGQEVTIALMPMRVVPSEKEKG